MRDMKKHCLSRVFSLLRGYSPLPFKGLIHCLSRVFYTAFQGYSALPFKGILHCLSRVFYTAFQGYCTLLFKGVLRCLSRVFSTASGGLSPSRSEPVFLSFRLAYSVPWPTTSACPTRPWSRLTSAAGCGACGKGTGDHTETGGGAAAPAGHTGM